MLSTNPKIGLSGLLLLVLACEGQTPLSDAGMHHDAGVFSDAAGPIADAGFGDVASAPDGGTRASAMTWSECRRAHFNEALGEEERLGCQADHRAPATNKRLGLRWIFLGHDPATVATYPESQLADLNAIFAPSQMQFFIHSRLRIVDPIAVEGSSGHTERTIAELIPDLRQLLETEESEPAALLEILLDRLAEKGVNVRERNGITAAINLNSLWRDYTLHGVAARLHDQVITVVVRNAPGDKSTGSYPSQGNLALSAGRITLASITELSALPHEMGHFFGLVHTHGIWPRRSGATQDWNMAIIERFNSQSWARLRALAGEDFTGRFNDSYLPFDCEESAREAFEEGQLVARKILGWSELTYRSDFEAIDDDASFVQMLLQGETPKMKNFVRLSEQGDFTGNNCGKSWTGEDRSTLRCKYGDGADHRRLTVADPLVAGSLIFGEASDEANLMSYISTNTDDGVRRKRHLTQRQRDLIRLGSRMPSRQCLRNFAP